MATAKKELKRCANEHANAFFLLCIKKALIRHFSPTTIDFSAIVKVSGQNCFRTKGSTKVAQCLWFSGADCFGLLRRFRQGCTKAPRFFKFCGVPFSLGQLPKGSVFKGSVVHQGSTKVSPSLRKFRDLSGSVEVPPSLL